MIPELVSKLPKVYIIIGFLRFYFKVDVQVAFYKNENFQEFSCFGYFFRLLVEIFYISKNFIFLGFEAI